MCGIAGIAGFADKQTAAEKIGGMMDSLAHRGPDAEGRFVDDGIAFGHRRLSIIDLSEAANQPMFDATRRYAIILNGEIYNYRDVKRAVPDYPYSTESDTETILAAFIKHGPDCLSLLNGMFAFAVWDSAKRELFVARDRLGVKPLYYSVTKTGVFVFASEIRAILNSGLVPRKVSEQGLYDYIMYQSVYSPNTIVEGISQLPAGNYCTYSGSTLQIKPYWQIEKNALSQTADTETEVKKKIRDLLLSSVEMRMISDVRLGAFLSGGIDSSAVIGLMSEVSQQPVDTFSVTFAEKEFDESRYSSLIAKRFNTRHTSVTLTAKNFLEELPKALSSTDSPSGDGLNTYVVSKATRQAGLKVALSGLGGDELFVGYPNFLRWFGTQTGLVKRVPSFLRKTAGSVFALSNNSKHQRAAAALGAERFDLSGIYPMFRQVLSEQAATSLRRKNGCNINIQETLEEKTVNISKFPLLSQFSIAELLGYTQNVLLKDTDQYSMASALEVREPFFDYRLVEYVLGVPDGIKYPKYQKSLLVEALAPMLPDEIVHRKKMGFAMPFETWMRNELKDFCSDRIKALAERGLVDANALNRSWNSFLNRSGGVIWSHLWHLIVLEDWLETNQF